MLRDEGFERTRFFTLLKCNIWVKTLEHIQKNIIMERNRLVEVLLSGFDAIPGSGRLFVSNREGIPCGEP
jgi:hypothetical protein